MQKLCLIHANCQGEPVARLLALSPEFSQYFYIKYVVNYTREPIVQEDLQQCALFLYQYLDEKWDTLSSAHLLQQLPPTAISLCLPNMFFNGYWPLWTNESSMNFGDFLLDSLVDKGMSLDSIMITYYLGKLVEQAGIADLVEKSLKIEKQREAHCDLPYVDFVQEHWKKELLFTTINHPGPQLLLRTANEILKHLGLPLLPPDTPPESCDQDFHLPIHPKVAQFWNLPFGGEKQSYAVCGKKLRFFEYMCYYVDCRLLGNVNFLNYLRSV